jgi:hypothetical protein
VFNFFESGIESGPPGIKHDVPLRPQLGAMQTESLAQTAFDAVALDGAAHGAGNGKSQPRTILWFGNRASQTEGGEQGAGDAETMIINESEFDRTEDPA